MYHIVGIVDCSFFKSIFIGDHCFICFQEKEEHKPQGRFEVKSYAYLSLSENQCSRMSASLENLYVCLLPLYSAPWSVIGPMSCLSIF